MNKDDLRFLTLLFEDGRARFNRLASKLKVRNETVARRYQQLVEHYGLRVYPLINFERMGLRRYYLYLDLENWLPHRKEITDALLSIPSIYRFHRLEGQWDFRCEFIVNDRAQLIRDLNPFLTRFGYTVNRKEFIIPLHQVFHTKKGHTLGEYGERPVVISDTDIRILDALMEDGRMSLLSIARKVSLTPEAVSYRLKKMMKEDVITLFTVSLDPRRVPAHVLHLRLNDPNFNLGWHYSEEMMVMGDWDAEVIFYDLEPTVYDRLMDKLVDFKGVKDHSSYNILDEYMKMPRI
ncbi:MAG: AsnC family transcriptional regulator [Candidatus Asgardarchaeia archaeon]